MDNFPRIARRSELLGFCISHNSLRVFFFFFGHLAGDWTLSAIDWLGTFTR